MTERRSKVYYLIHPYYLIHHGIFFANKYGTLGGYFTISPFLVFVNHNVIDFHFVDFIAKRP